MTSGIPAHLRGTRPSATPASLLPFAIASTRGPFPPPALLGFLGTADLSATLPGQPDPRGLSVGACHATGRASRVASNPLFHTCHRQYPGGTGRCSRRSFPDRWQPSPFQRRVGFRSARFEAPARRLLALWPVWSLSRPRRPFVIGVLQTMLLPPPSAPTATGWSDSCRAGFAPAEEWRLLTAHVKMYAGSPRRGLPQGSRGTPTGAARVAPTFVLKYNIRTRSLAHPGTIEDVPGRRE